MASRKGRMHGRIEGAQSRCAVPGCDELGEFRAPIESADFNGPGRWRLLCLDHVRAHNSAYNFFEGMSPDEIAEAQTPYGGWERATRAFATAGADPAPAWSDFSDPLDAISARFRQPFQQPRSRFSSAERRALGVLGLGEEANRHALRERYSKLVRRFHPDKNGGDRSHETRLREVIDAYQALRKSPAFG